MEEFTEIDHSKHQIEIRCIRKEIIESNDEINLRGSTIWYDRNSILRCLRR